MPDGKAIASREAWMMMHPGFNAGYFPGDLVELQEGIFVLNDDLNPMEKATPEQITAAWDDEPDMCTDFNAFVERQKPERL